MGNKAYSENEELVNHVRQLHHQRTNSSENIESHNCYRALMIFSLQNSQLYPQYKLGLTKCIKQTINSEDIYSVFSSFNPRPPEQQSENPPFIQFEQKVAMRSNYVLVNFGELQIKSNSKSLQRQSMVDYHIQNAKESRIKSVVDYLKKDVSRDTHPFSKLCEAYAALVACNDQINKKCKCETEYEQWQQQFHNQIQQFCTFLVNGCMEIYKKWLLPFIDIGDKRYDHWIHSICLDQIWVSAKNALYHITLQLIQSVKIELNVSSQQIANSFLQGHIVPELFHIDAQLQIQGHFFYSVFELSEFSEDYTPSLILRRLENFNHRICFDIDNYHSLTYKKQKHEINGDNIMGIVAYLLAKTSRKLQSIYNQLLFLRLVYGQHIFYSMDISSYMFSTLIAAVQFLQSQQFLINPVSINGVKQK